MKCDNCGFLNETDSRFCIECGQDLKKTQEVDFSAEIIDEVVSEAANEVKKTPVPKAEIQLKGESEILTGKKKRKVWLFLLVAALIASNILTILLLIKKDKANPNTDKVLGTPEAAVAVVVKSVNRSVGHLGWELVM